jgi:hypothetical protein
MSVNVQIATLKRALELAPDTESLERALGLGSRRLDAMLEGHEPIPTWVFLRAVDFINEKAGPAARM